MTRELLLAPLLIVVDEAGSLERMCRQLLHQARRRSQADTDRAVVARDVRGLIELLEDVLREHLAELDTHLVWKQRGLLRF